MLTLKPHTKKAVILFCLSASIHFGFAVFSRGCHGEPECSAPAGGCCWWQRDTMAAGRSDCACCHSSASPGPSGCRSVRRYIFCCSSSFVFFVVVVPLSIQWFILLCAGSCSCSVSFHLSPCSSFSVRVCLCLSVCVCGGDLIATRYWLYLRVWLTLPLFLSTRGSYFEISLCSSATLLVCLVCYLYTHCLLIDPVSAGGATRARCWPQPGMMTASSLSPWPLAKFCSPCQMAPAWPTSIQYVQPS